MVGLVVFFSGSVSISEFDSSFLYSEVVIFRIDEFCLRLGELYGL